MSDVMTSQRAQELSERTRVGLQKVHGAVQPQTPLAVFPDDRVELSNEAKNVVAGGSAELTDKSDTLEQAVLMGTSTALDHMNAQLDRLMNIYGVNSQQTTRAGQKVTEALRNEVRRLAGTVMPPALDVQVKQELNMIARQIEIKLEATGQTDSETNVSVDITKVDFEYNFEEAAGALLVPPGSTGTDPNGNTLDVSQASNGLYFLDGAQSGTGGPAYSGTGENPYASAAGASPFDRFSARPDTGQASDANPAAAAGRPDTNQDGSRNAADSNALLVVRNAPAQDHQIATGISVFVADLAVPIQIRGSEATPSRSQRGYQP